MTLPVINTPQSHCILPITKKNVKFRAFTVAEEQNLLMVKEGGNPDDLDLAVIDIIKKCTFDEVAHPERFPFVDILFLFLKISGLSKGDKNEVIFRCLNKPDGTEECGQQFNVTIDTRNVEVVKQKDFIDTVTIDGITFKMKYPSIEETKRIASYKEDAMYQFYAIAICIESIATAEDIIVDIPIEELVEWLGGFTGSKLEELDKFFSNLPSLELTVKTKCPKCGHEETINYKGIEDFFI